MGTGVFIKGRGEAARLRGRLFSSRLTSRLRFARRQDSLGAAEECRKNRYIQAASLVTSSKRTRVISRECRRPTVDLSMIRRTSSATKIPLFLAIFSDTAFCGFERKMSVRTYPMLYGIHL